MTKSIKPHENYNVPFMELDAFWDKIVEALGGNRLTELEKCTIGDVIKYYAFNMRLLTVSCSPKEFDKKLEQILKSANKLHDYLVETDSISNEMQHPDVDFYLSNYLNESGEFDKIDEGDIRHIELKETISALDARRIKRKSELRANICVGKAIAHEFEYIESSSMLPDLYISDLAGRIRKLIEIIDNIKAPEIHEPSDHLKREGRIEDLYTKKFLSDFHDIYTSKTGDEQISEAFRSIACMIMERISEQLIDIFGEAGRTQAQHMTVDTIRERITRYREEGGPRIPLTEDKERLKTIKEHLERLYGDDPFSAFPPKNDTHKNHFTISKPNQSDT